MGGGGPSFTPAPVPAAPAPIDYDKMAESSIRIANAQTAAEEAAIKRIYPEYIRMQFGTADQLAGKLDNDYLRQSRSIIRDELGAASSPTAIEAELQRQAQQELALGRALTPEQERQAQQSARAAFASRGLATGNAALGAEILNRDAYGQQRQDARRAFAFDANALDMARRQRRIGLGGMLLETDPYRQALGPAFGLGGDTLRTSQGQVSNIFGNSLQQAGNVASFNTNMAMSQHLGALNNNAALQGAAMQTGATKQAGMMGLFGNALQGGIQAGGMIGAAKMAPMMFSDKRMKTDIKPIGKAGKVLGLTAYKYRYKGDKEKRVGFMAQDVARVLPEAVAEVTYQGKKRLAIKPGVLGAALAEELMTAKAA